VHLEGGISLYPAPGGRVGFPLPAGVADPEIRWSRVDPGLAGAGRVTLTLGVGAGDVLEARGTWYGHTEGQSRETGVIAFRNPAPAVTPLLSVDLSTEMDGYGFELSWLRELEPDEGTHYALGLGFRWMRFEEEARMDRWAPAPGPPGTPFVRSRTVNELVGGQIVGAAWRDVSDELALKVVAKGIFGSVRRDLVVEDEAIFSGGQHRSTDETSEFGWAVEATLALGYRVSPRVALTLGYTVLYVDKVVRANDALDFGQAGSGVVRTRRETDNLLTHLAFFGVEFGL
jgi:hypothetical protein